MNHTECRCASKTVSCSPGGAGGDCPGGGRQGLAQGKTRSLAGDAPGAHGRGASLCTLGLVADFVISSCKPWDAVIPLSILGVRVGGQQAERGQAGPDGSVVAHVPTSNCFCYLIMSQAGKHPPHADISGATFAAGPRGDSQGPR